MTRQRVKAALPLGLAAVGGLSLAGAAPAAAEVKHVDNDRWVVGTAGYVRGGVGFSENSGDPECYQLPGAPAKYRLGNECEFYTEIGASVLSKDAGDLESIGFEGRIGHYQGPANDFENDDTTVPELWMSLDTKSDSWLNGGRLWGGQRFYRRSDVHINDFYYWEGTGTGVGVDRIELGTGLLAVAYFWGSNNTLSAEDDLGYDRYDVRWGQIPVNDGTLEVGMDVRRARDVEDPESDWGARAAVRYKHPVWNGFNEISLQAGLGAGSSLSNQSDPDAEAGDAAVRLVEQIVVNPDPRYTGAAAAFAEVRPDGTLWLSAGIRPIWNVTDLFSLQTEFGVDRVDPPDEDARHLGKATLAATIKQGNDFFSRPELRLYVTYAKWDREAQAAGLLPDRADRSGVTAGIQFEYFW